MPDINTETAVDIINDMLDEDCESAPSLTTTMHPMDWRDV